MPGPAELLAILGRGEPELDTTLNSVPGAFGPSGRSAPSSLPPSVAPSSASPSLADIFSAGPAPVESIGSPVAPVTTPTPTLEDALAVMPEESTTPQAPPLPPNRAGYTDPGNDTLNRIRVIYGALENTKEGDPVALAEQYRQLLGPDEPETAELSPKEIRGLALLAIRNPGIVPQYLGQRRAAAERAAERNRERRATALSLGERAARRSYDAERQKHIDALDELKTVEEFRTAPLREKQLQATIDATNALAANRRAEAGAGGMNQTKLRNQVALRADALQKTRLYKSDRRAALLRAEQELGVPGLVTGSLSESTAAAPPAPTPATTPSGRKFTVVE